MKECMHVAWLILWHVRVHHTCWSPYSSPSPNSFCHSKRRQWIKGRDWGTRSSEIPRSRRKGWRNSPGLTWRGQHQLLHFQACPGSLYKARHSPGPPNCWPMPSISDLLGIPVMLETMPLTLGQRTESLESTQTWPQSPVPLWLQTSYFTSVALAPFSFDCKNNIISYLNQQALSLWVYWLVPIKH